MSSGQTPPQREIVRRVDLNFWAPAGSATVSVDFSQPPYSLNFTPDAVYIKTVAYITKQEQNPAGATPCLTCNFTTDAGDPFHVIGIISAAGSISHPNTLHYYNTTTGGTLGQTCSFAIRLLTTSGVTDINNAVNNSAWYVALEFIKYACTMTTN